MINKLVSFFRSQTVLCIAFILSCITMFIIPPNQDYIGYIDFSTLILLFSLMGAVAGFNKCGIFKRLSNILVNKCKSLRMISLLLMNICFFSSMLITNDVALLTFIPVTVLVFSEVKSRSSFPLIFTVVLETVAANLGSMLLPTGNPQNIYLCSYFELSPFTLIKTLIPFGIISYIILSFSVFLLPKKNISTVKDVGAVNDNLSWITLISCTVIFIISLLTVSGIIHEYVCLAVSLLLITISGFDIFRKIDYSLILTFVFFFIFVGNLGCIDSIKNFLSEIISGREIIVSVLSSQIFSNVPAAILLSGFTDKAECLLIGTNIGGLGTPIASLASLISFRIYMGSKDATAGKYIGTFLLYNTILLLILCLLSTIIR